MKAPATLTLLVLLLAMPRLSAQEEEEPPPERTRADILQAQEEKLRRETKTLADRQDELSTNLRDIIENQTNAEVITELEKIDFAMMDAVDLLDFNETGGETIAAETEVIELILAAAEKAAEQSQGQGDGTMGSMLEMLKQMAGQGQSSQPGGQGAGDQAGLGMTGDSESANSLGQGTSQLDFGGERTVEKGGGSYRGPLPAEYQDFLSSFFQAADEPAP
ncbi:MAG: hypothetical protein AAF555_08510 [Verrucomicrobiota bacterium]